MMSLRIRATILASAVLTSSSAFGGDRVGLVAAAAEAARNFATPAGHAYALTFVRDVLKAVYDAQMGCGRPQFRPDATHDIVFIVSSDGRIERTISKSKTPYGRCVDDALRLPKTVSVPPGAHWAVQLRFVNGPRRTEGPDPPFIILSLPDKHG